MTMRQPLRLDVHTLDIEEVRLGEVTAASGHTLTVSVDEVTASVLEDPRIAGVSVEVAFAISLPDGVQRFSVRGRISRITRQGIGVQFSTHNPPQLAALREIFNGVQQRTVPGAAAPVGNTPAAVQPDRKRILEKPSEDAAWANWELLD